MGEVMAELSEGHIIRKKSRDFKEEEMEKYNDSMGLKFLEIQEEERKRVARELHDSTVQNLTSLIYKAELCSKVLEVDPVRVRLELQVMISSLKSIIEEMRNTIYDLRPTVLEEYNFSQYIEKHINNLIISHPNISFQFKVNGVSKKVKSIYCLTLLRIIQEACQNAIKHANAKSIVVELTYYDAYIGIKIFDNGNGFDVEQVNEKLENEGHFGMSIMKERAQLLGGELTIRSQKDKGTVVTINVSKVYYVEGEEDGSN